VRSNQQFDFSIPYEFGVLILDRSIEELSNNCLKEKANICNSKKCQEMSRRSRGGSGGCCEILLDALLFNGYS
jgi:hypothetical protein